MTYPHETTIQVPLYVGWCLVGEAVDFNVTLVLDEYGELIGVQCPEYANFQSTANVVEIDRCADMFQMQVWGAAAAKLASDSQHILSEAGVPSTATVDQSAPIYGVGFKGGRYAA